MLLLQGEGAAPSRFYLLSGALPPRPVYRGKVGGGEERRSPAFL